MTALLELKQVSIAYGEQRVVHDFSFLLEKNRIACFLGPSGCGKTTLLRAIAGFEPVLKGHIYLNGQRVSEPGYTVPSERRQIGVVFQDYALFPHLTVKKNIAFGLRLLGPSQKTARIAEVLDLVGLGDVAERYPHELSGGQQQRVALARAIAPKPQLVLIDEPFSNLDTVLREHLGHELRRILKESQMSAILVTHDQQEAFVIADEIGVIDQGRLQQWGDAYALYNQPENPFVARFIGQGALLAAVVREKGILETALGELKSGEATKLSIGTQVVVLIRPNHIKLDSSDNVNATIVGKAFRGMDVLYTLNLNTGQSLQAVVMNQRDYPIGTRIKVSPAVEEPIIVQHRSYEN